VDERLVGVVCDAMKLQGLGSFDFVLGAIILHHLEPFSAFCSALKAALKPGGKAFFYENNAARIMRSYSYRQLLLIERVA
jgi:2-polyprenyl-3-methyl-5-hydroxy-6-metoxy-1,4-benzoquinol methylase